MKSLIAFTALTISSSVAFAIDIYDGFIGPDVVSTYNGPYGDRIIDPAPSLVDPKVSLFEFVAGNPDSDNGRPIPGYVPIVDPTAPRFTSLDEFTYGNPDSGVGVRIPPDVVGEFGKRSFF